MSTKLKRVSGEPNLLISERGTFYTYFFNREHNKLLRVSTHEKQSVVKAREIALKKFKYWDSTLRRQGCNTRFDDLCNELLDKYKNGERKRTYKATLTPIKHLLKTFSCVKIAYITKDDFFLKHVTRVRSEGSLRNLNNERKIFIQVLFIAYRRGLIKTPPLGIAMPSIKKEVGKCLTGEEIIKIFTACDNRDLCMQLKLGLTTGMRLREVLFLKWSYIDFESRIITLPASITKTKRGRFFMVNKQTVERLKIFKQKQKPSEYLFPSPHDLTKPVFSNKVALKRLKRLSGVSFTFHDLRRSCATMKVKAGIPPAIIAKEIGMSVDVLNNIYTKLKPDDFRQSAEVISIPVLPPPQ